MLNAKIINVMETKRLNFEQMENLEGGGVPRWLVCGATIAGSAIAIAGMFAVPVGGAALAIYAANAILSPTVIGVGIVASCFKENQMQSPNVTNGCIPMIDGTVVCL